MDRTIQVHIPQRAEETLFRPVVSNLFHVLIGVDCKEVGIWTPFILFASICVTLQLAVMAVEWNRKE